MYRLFNLYLNLIVRLRKYRHRIFRRHRIKMRIRLLRSRTRIITSSPNLILINRLLAISMSITTNQLFRGIRTTSNDEFTTTKQSSGSRLFTLNSLRIRIFRSIRISRMLIGIFRFSRYSPHLSLSYSIIHTPTPQATRPIQLSQATRGQGGGGTRDRSVRLDTFTFVNWDVIFFHSAFGPWDTAGVETNRSAFYGTTRASCLGSMGRQIVDEDDTSTATYEVDRQIAAYSSLRPVHLHA